MTNVSREGGQLATVRVTVNPELLRWACVRAGDRADALRAKFPKLNDWIEGRAKPTLKQLEEFAKSAHVPLGYLLLPSPPAEQMPIQDLRTMGSKSIYRPSPNLLDVIYLCQRRQDWYREHVQTNREEPNLFVGSANLDQSPTTVAEHMRRVLDFDVDVRRNCHDVSDAMRMFIDHTEAAGVLVMVSGIVKNITNRPLDPEEFRGFALADPFAPLIFINGVDSKPAQMFTLAHELAHLWLGESAVSNAGLRGTISNRIEKWCNRVAAEFLVPLVSLRVPTNGDPLDFLDEYSREFKVSKLVILRRLLDSGLIDHNQFSQMYSTLNQPPATTQPVSGGDFYNTMPARASKRFVKALVASTLEGHTLYRDAFKLLGISSEKTFRAIGQKVGVS